MTKRIGKLRLSRETVRRLDSANRSAHAVSGVSECQCTEQSYYVNCYDPNTVSTTN